MAWSAGDKDDPITNDISSHQLPSRRAECGLVFRRKSYVRCSKQSSRPKHWRQIGASSNSQHRALAACGRGRSVITTYHRPWPEDPQRLTMKGLCVLGALGQLWMARCARWQCVGFTMSSRYSPGPTARRARASRSARSGNADTSLVSCGNVNPRRREIFLSCVS